MTFRAPEGTKDILPPQAELPSTEEPWRNVALWHRLEATVRKCFARFGYEEVRPPIFEYTALFHKSSGETTDIVEKEMFTFGNPEGEGGTFSLRPEITPGTIRALVENSLFARRNFWKVWYMGPCFRKERPQKGRYRQFNQIGVEAAGAIDPLADAETMILFASLLDAVGVKEWKLKINSMGCSSCRGTYREALKGAVRPNLEKHCANCRRRFERNVFRVLDCKVPECKALADGYPAALDSLCDGCKAHMKGVEEALRGAGLPYRVDPRIVRGLDYYTRTVYEFTSSRLGAQDALCGGGRYDTLVRDMGGPDVGSVGFAAGCERILLAMEGEAATATPDFYAVAIRPELREGLFQAVTRLRREGLSGDMDFEGRSVKAQFRMANKSRARYALIVGPEEAEQGKVKLKNMTKEDEERAVTLEEAAAVMKEGIKP